MCCQQEVESVGGMQSRGEGRVVGGGAVIGKSTNLWRGAESLVCSVIVFNCQAGKVG